MDPMQTWILILASWKEADWDSLFEYSDALIEWIQNGGFPPPLKYDAPTSEGLNKTLVLAVCTMGRALADAKLCSEEGLPTHVPFSIVCRDCAVKGPQYFFVAKQDGWAQIEFVPESLSENYSGICPNCQAD